MQGLYKTYRFSWGEKITSILSFKISHASSFWYQTLPDTVFWLQVELF